MKEVHTIYKLIILYMLKKVEFPLTNSQISAFILEEQYTDYFTLQETLSDMVESRLLETQTIRNSTHYSLTDLGKETLEYFRVYGLDYGKIHIVFRKWVLDFGN